MNIFLYIFMLTIWLTTVQSRLKVSTRPISNAKGKPFFNDDLQHKPHKDHPELRIPNAKFCADMSLKSSQLYLVLPWWYNYCQLLSDAKTKSYQKNKLYYLPLYKNILDQLKKYKRDQKIIEHEKSSLMQRLEKL